MTNKPVTDASERIAELIFGTALLTFLSAFAAVMLSTWAFIAWLLWQMFFRPLITLVGFPL